MAEELTWDNYSSTALSPPPPTDYRRVSPALQASRDRDRATILTNEALDQLNRTGQIDPMLEKEMGLAGVPVPARGAEAGRVPIIQKSDQGNASWDDFADNKRIALNPMQMVQNTVGGLTKSNNAGLKKLGLLSAIAIGGAGGGLVLDPKATVGEAAAIADMVASFPGFIGSFISNLETAGLAGLRGESRETAWKAGRIANEEFLGGLLNSPVKKFMDYFQSGKAYEDSLTSKGMEKVGSAIEEFGQWVEKKSDGSIPKEAVQTFADALMIGAPTIGARIFRGGARPGEEVPKVGEPTKPTGQGIREAETGRPVEVIQRGEARPTSAPVAPTRGELEDINAIFRDTEPSRATQESFQIGTHPDDIALRDQLKGAEDRIAELSKTVEDAQRRQAPPEELIPLAEQLRQVQQDVRAMRQAQEQQANASANASMSPGETAALAATVGATGAALYAADQVEWLPAVGAMMIPALPRHPATMAAVRMAREGRTGPEIWEATRRNYGVPLWQEPHTGRWLQEIPDYKAVLTPQVRTEIPGRETLVEAVKPGGMSILGRVLQHPALYVARPGMGSIPVIPREFGPTRGSYSHEPQGISIAPGPLDQVRSTLLHEVQHGVQYEEGLPVGGSAKTGLPKDFEAQKASIDTSVNQLGTAILQRNPGLLERIQAGGYKANPLEVVEAVYTQLMRQGRMPYEARRIWEIVRSDPDGFALSTVLQRKLELEEMQTAAFSKYWQQSGEAMARLVQARANMTPERLARTYPGDQWDVPPSEQLVTMPWERRTGPSEAVKEKGGMWHPEAVERLKDALIGDRIEVEYVREGRNDMLGARPAEVKAYHTWSEKAIRNYLNKHAGTETDPLKDVEIPFGEGTKRWEDVTDAIIKGKTLYNKEPGKAIVADTAEYTDRFPGSKPGETVWDIPAAGGWSTSDVIAAEHAIKQQLSHVGDYLRQNVSPEKLAQYDLVRAVRETAVNDARVAREMEKAAQASTKDLPVYKDYGDGYKWVELKLPEKLTEEQANMVRRATREDLQYPITDPHFEAGGPLYVAIGPDKKPIKNNYTGDIIASTTPEKAWLAGELAKEGNQMGHCVGGYCEGVASGESRIFSLRDAKGKSHVTVEVEPAGAKPLDPVGAKDDAILQIKGKQNRAPSSEYLPYVQDFVKSGKWGGVGDLGNTGLMETGNLTPQAIEILQSEGVDTSGRYISSTDYGRVMAMRRAPPGNIELFALAGGATALGAAYLSDQDELTAGLGLAMAAGIPTRGRGRLGRATEPVRSGFDYAIGNLSTRMRNMDPSIARPARDLERRTLTVTHGLIEKVNPFRKELAKVGGSAGDALRRAILTNDAPAVSELLRQINRPELTKAWQTTRAVLNNVGDRLHKLGFIAERLPDYFPRIVQDLPGLLDHLGSELRSGIEKALHNANGDLIKSRGYGLTGWEQSDIVNRMLRAHRRLSGQPGFAKERTIQEITPDIEKYYATPAEAIDTYLRHAVAELEKARFFGKDRKMIKKGSQEYIDMDKSIGNLTGRLLAEKKITGNQAEELRSMLASRFGPGERGAAGWIQDFRNITYAGLLGNPISAGTQFGDLMLAAAHYGLRPTMQTLVKTLTGRAPVTMKEYGLVDHIYEEFASTRGSAKFLNRMLRWGGFQTVDKLGKNFALNAALNRATNLTKSAGGIKRLERRWGRYYGEDFPQLVQDLKNGQRTDLVDSLLFSELSDIQPISRMELPQGYLDAGNFGGRYFAGVGRLPYMLKTFMLKQLDLLRREAYNEIKAGNVARGLYNLAKYTTVLGVSGATTQQLANWLMGRDDELTLSDVPLNVLKTFGWSQYVLDMAAEGQIVKATISTMTPPYRMIDDIIQQDPRAISYVPVFGRLYYENDEDMKDARREFLREQARGRRERAQERRLEQGR